MTVALSALSLSGRLTVIGGDPVREVEEQRRVGHGRLAEGLREWRRASARQR